MPRTRENNNLAEKARYRKVINEAIANRGGQCEFCGGSEQLQFHHIDPGSKVANATRLWSIPARFVEELEKCRLLCRPCHLAEHAPPHGTRGRYTHYACRCDQCKRAQTEYMREYKKLRRKRTERK